MQKNRKKKLDNVGFGLFTGLLLPVIIFVVIYLVRDNSLSFSDYMKSLWMIHVLLKVGSLCVLANVAAFWGFLHLKYERAARGVLGATILWAFAVLISKAF